MRRSKVTYSFKLSELEDQIENEVDSCIETEKVEYAAIGDECFNFPSDDSKNVVTIKYSEIDIDLDAVRRLMFD